jgi:hypothetical protein
VVLDHLHFTCHGSTILVNGAGSRIDSVATSLEARFAFIARKREPKGLRPHHLSSRYLQPPAGTWEKGRNSKAAGVAGWKLASADALPLQGKKHSQRWSSIRRNCVCAWLGRLIQQTA